MVNDHPVEQLLLDSRKAYTPATSLFFALVSSRRNGHDYIGELYHKGVRSFVISQQVPRENFPDANFITVSDTIAALQQLAAWHRAQFSVPVIGITGSNGKTIVKEWLFQLLHEDYIIVRSPKSYNSQIGVPLSIWQLRSHHTMAIFEAGISQTGEMEKLENMIRPTIGLFTSLGEAHSEGFRSLEEKESEKKILFKNAVVPEKLKVISTESTAAETKITAIGTGDIADKEGTLVIPFTDKAAIQNAVTCWELMLHLGYPQNLIAARMKNLTAVDMRLSLKKGVHHCLLVNDSYCADKSSLEIALHFMVQQSVGLSRTVILTDFVQTAEEDEILYAQLADLLHRYGVNRLIAIGPRISRCMQQLVHPGEFRLECFESTESYLTCFSSLQFKEEIILVKGARSFALERIAALLEQKAHQTRLEVELGALLHNLHQYKKQLRSDTRVMAMVKAFGYGSGGAEVAGWLQYNGVNYLGVAYADEGVELRRAGITLPIMVMNPEESAFDSILDHQLEPELYSFEIAHAFDRFLQGEGVQGYPVHIEIETGMNRLGFAGDEVTELGNFLCATSSFTVRSVFSHLAASEDPGEDAYTQGQFEKFMKAANQLQAVLDVPFIRHIANSAAAIRHPQLELDMVRLGIGLYGIETAAGLDLKPVATLKSTIAQIKTLQVGDSVSYNRKTILDRPSRIATIRMGYADGYPRQLGNGIGKVSVNGKWIPIVGSVCMDMFMADITELPEIKEGDEVELFGSALPVQQLAQWANTIPYEILTGISQRVKRVYFED